MRFLLFLTVLIWSAPTFAQNVVVENFIAPNCGVVMDSEKNLKSIKDANDDVLILTCHLDESLGVSETVAQTCMGRKFQYLSKWFMSDPASPTIIIDGAHKTRGLYEKVVSSGVDMARAEYDLSQIQMRIVDGTIIAELPKINVDQMAELWVFGYDKAQNLDLGAQAAPLPVDDDHPHDEDGNHIETPMQQPVDTTVTFMNVVRGLKRLDIWSGRPETIRIPINNFKADEFAIIAQGQHLGDIVAVGTVATSPSN